MLVGGGCPAKYSGNGGRLDAVSHHRFGSSRNNVARARSECGSLRVGIHVRSLVASSKDRTAAAQARWRRLAADRLPVDSPRLFARIRLSASGVQVRDPTSAGELYSPAAQPEVSRSGAQRGMSRDIPRRDFSIFSKPVATNYFVPSSRISIGR